MTNKMRARHPQMRLWAAHVLAASIGSICGILAFIWLAGPSLGGIIWVGVSALVGLAALAVPRKEMAS